MEENLKVNHLRFLRKNETVLAKNDFKLGGGFMKKYSAAIIGCGWVSGEHIKAYTNNPLTEVVGLASLTKEEAQEKAEEFGLDVPCFNCLEEMIKEVDPDMISVTSRPDFHVEHGITVAESGKSLVMEKPVAVHREELKKLVDCVKANQTKSIVSFVLRWNPLCKIIRSLLDNDMIGEVFMGEVDYYHGIGPWYNQFHWNITKRAGGNSLLSAGCHAVDALVWFMGSRVKEVHAYSTRSDSEHFRPYEYDPSIVTLLKFENGRIGKVSSCIECNSPYEFLIRLFGSKGTIKDNLLYSHKLAGQTDFAEIPTIHPDSGDVTHHPFQGEIDRFVECLERDQDTCVSIEYAAHIMEVCYAAEESANTGQSVTISEF